MTDESKETTATETPKDAAAPAAVEGQAKRPEPIAIDPEELTDEGRKKAEEALGRKIEDAPYTLAGEETRPGSVLAMRFEVAAADFQSEQNRQLEDLRKEVTLPGFRKGKAPLKLIQIRLGDETVRTTVGSVASNVLRQEHLKRNLILISKPQVVDYRTPEGDGPLKLEIEAEIEPKVELKDYKGLSVEVEDRPIEEKQVDERLEALRRQNAVEEPAPAGAVYKVGDTLTVDIDVRNARGERMEHLSAEGRAIDNPEETLPVSVADLLPGKKVGETIETDAENKTTNRRGEEVAHVDHYKVTLREIRAAKLPELDDEFAKDLGEHETLEALRESIRKDLAAAEEARQRREALTKIFEQMLVKNPVDAPRSLLARQQFEMIQRDTYELSRMGLRLEHLVHDADKYISDQRTGAAVQVKLQFLLRELARIEKLEVSDGDVEAEIGKIAERTKRNPLAVRARLEATKELDRFREQLRVRKLEDLLLAASTIKKAAPKPQESQEASEGIERP
jgi:trigger factor